MGREHSELGDGSITAEIREHFRGSTERNEDVLPTVDARTSDETRDCDRMSGTVQQAISTDSIV